MKNIQYNWFLSLLILAGMMLPSCDPADFGDLNVDPNSPSNVNTGTLLGSAIRGLPGDLTDATTELYVQHLSEKYYTDASRYTTVNFDFAGFYAGALADLTEIIRILNDPELSKTAPQFGSVANQMAVARILRAYYFLHITDRWGDVPYTQALQGDGEFQPGYDTQQAIYNDLFKELKEAAAQTDGGAGPSGDFLLDGDMDQWKRFANSLRLVMALRISQADEAKGKAEFTDALNAGVIESDVAYSYLSEETNDNPWEDRFETRLDYNISKTLVDYMKPLGDPRLAVYAEPAVASQDFVGMPYGLPQAEAGAITNNSVSFLGKKVRQKTSPSFVLTRAQVLFSLAEATQRGWISGGEAKAADYYKEAIQASWEQWGVYSEAAFNTFMAQPQVAYSAADGLKLIHYQKWVALYLQGIEAWSEWRRTGIPVLQPSPAPIHPSGKIPLRQGYPTTERDLNSDNYQSAVSKMGKDDLDVPVWWDK